MNKVRTLLAIVLVILAAGTGQAQTTVYLPVVMKGETMAVRGQHWYIVIPEQTENYFTNPSVEKGTTGFSAYNGSTLARTADTQIRGVYSLAVTPTSNTTGGVDYAQSLAAATWTLSVDVRGADGVPYIIEAISGGSPVASLAFTADGRWARYALDDFTLGSSGTVTLRIRKNNSSGTAVFYVDGLQAEQKGYATDYCDGDQDGCQWSAGAHQSKSIRLKYFPASGRAVNLQDYGFFIDAAEGMGLPSIQITAIQAAQGDGSVVKNTRLADRTLVLQGQYLAGQNESVTDREQARRTLHQIRSQLLGLLYPGRYPSRQPVYFRYTGSGKTLQAGVYPNPSDQTGRNTPLSSPNGLRLYAADPYVEQVSRIFTSVEIGAGVGTGASGSSGAAGANGGGGGDNAAELSPQESIADANRIIQRLGSGEWDNMADGLNGTVICLAVAPDGTLYAGGNFTTAGGSSANYVAAWNGSTWSALGTGMNDIVWALAVGPDGTLYAGGEFTTAGGSTVNYVAAWNGSAWSALGSGMGNHVYALAVAPDGTLYAGGIFYPPLGSYYRIAAWNGSAWSALGSGMNNYVTSLAVAPDGTLYAGGWFTTAGGSSANYVAAWNGSTWSALGTGMNGDVLALAIGLDGALYAGGRFTTAGGSTVNYVAAWNGSAWSALNSGTNDEVWALAVAPDGALYAGGEFTAAGGISFTDRGAKWNGSSWLALPINLPGTSTVRAFVFGDTAIIAFNTSGTAVASQVSTIENLGNAEAYPIVRYAGAGRLYELSNEDLGEIIYFNYTLLDGEEVVVDLRPGLKTVVSSFNGNLLIRGAVLPGSDLATLRLLPGENGVSNLINDAGATGTIEWKNLFVSFDG